MRCWVSDTRGALLETAEEEGGLRPQHLLQGMCMLKCWGGKSGDTHSFLSPGPWMRQEGS